MSIMRQLTRTQITGLVLVISILFVDMLLYSLFIPVVPYFTETYQMSSTMVGILFGSYAAGLFLTTPLFGRVTDKIGRRKTIVLGLLFMVGATLFFVFSTNTITLVIARLLQGVAAAASWTAALALLADLFPGPLRGTVMGIAMTGISSGSLLGAPIGGWLFEIGNHHTPFWFAAAITAVILILTLLFLREPARAAAEDNEGGSTLSLLRYRPILYTALVILLAETSLAMMEPLLPNYMTEKFQMSPITLGLLFGAVTLAYGLIAPVAGTLASRFNPYYIMLFGLGGIAIMLPMLTLVGSIPMAFVAACLVGASIGFTLSPTLPTLGAIVDKEAGGGYGVAYALFNMTHAIGMMMGPLLGGILTDTLSVSGALTGTSIVLLSCTLSGLIVLKRMPTVFTSIAAPDTAENGQSRA
ncbi:MFS transporter [Paenibacillus marinisediminis]